MIVGMGVAGVGWAGEWQNNLKVCVLLSNVNHTLTLICWGLRGYICHVNLVTELLEGYSATFKGLQPLPAVAEYTVIMCTHMHMHVHMHAHAHTHKHSQVHLYKSFTPYCSVFKLQIRKWWCLLWQLFGCLVWWQVFGLAVLYDDRYLAVLYSVQ